MEKNPVPRKKSESERIKQDLRRQISERKLLPETQLFQLADMACGDAPSRLDDHLAPVVGEIERQRLAAQARRDQVQLDRVLIQSDRKSVV